jgi:protein gp37
VSEGCRNCYAEKVAYRFSGERLDGKPAPYKGLVQRTSDGMRLPLWNGNIKFVEEHLLDPLRWKKPRRIFVNSMSDLFHENVTDEMRDRIFAVMALCPRHTFQVLTKRPERMLAYLRMLEDERDMQRWANAALDFDLGPFAADAVREWEWPLPNVQLGVSVEDQKAADERIPLLLQTPAAVRFISAEPLLGSMNIRPYLSAECMHEDSYSEDDTNATICRRCEDTPILDWVIVGGESGPGARPMHPDWARSLRDQCEAAGVPFFFKQWGEWGWEPPIRWTATPDMAGQLYGPFRPTCGGPGSDKRLMCRAYPAKIPADLGGIGDRFWVMLEEAHRIGKKAAGHLLDGREYHQFPAGSR